MENKEIDKIKKEIERLGNQIKIGNDMTNKELLKRYCKSSFDKLLEKIATLKAINQTQKSCIEDFKKKIDETWEERDKELKNIDTSKIRENFRQAVARVEKNEFRSLLLKKLK